MPTLYPSHLRSLHQACEQYRRRLITLDELKSHVWKTASLIAAIEERELRLRLQQLEVRLDIIQCTVEDEQIFDKSLEIVDRIEATVSEWL